MTCRHMKRPTRVRVSPSGRSRARLPLGRVPIRSDKIQRQPKNDEPRPADAGYSSCAQPVTGLAFPARAAMLFQLLSGSATPAQSDAGEAPPKQPAGCASLPKNQRLRLRPPKPPCIPYLEPPAISIEQFRRMRHFFSIAEDKPWPIQDIFLVMFSLLSRLMSRIDPPVPQQLDPRGNLLPNSGRKLLAAPHLLDKAPVRTPVRTPQILIDRCL